MSTETKTKRKKDTERTENGIRCIISLTENLTPFFFSVLQQHPKCISSSYLFSILRFTEKKEKEKREEKRAKNNSRNPQ